MSHKRYTFYEPHDTGGQAEVTITEQQILQFMKETRGILPNYKDATDEQLIYEFVVVHWCVEVK